MKLTVILIFVTLGVNGGYSQNDIESLESRTQISREPSRRSLRDRAKAWF